MTPTIPRGLRNANPLNIRPSKDKWIGLRAEQNDPGYLQFQTSFHGIRAGVLNLLTYYRVRLLQTPFEIIDRWAPASDNNPTDSYVTVVSEALGVGAHDRIDLDDRAVMRKLVKTMISVECGQQPFSDLELDVAINAAYGSHSTQPANPSAPYIRPEVVQPPAPAPAPPKVFPEPAPVSPAPASPAPASPAPTSPIAPASPPLVNQPSSGPTRKVMIGGTVGMAAFVVTIFWNRLFPSAPIPEEYAEEIGGLVVLATTLITQYFVRNRATDIPPGETPKAGS